MRKLLFLAMLCPLLSMCQPITVKGKIINEQGEPVAGATITLKRPANSHPSVNDQQPSGNDPSPVITQLSSNSRGEFSLTGLRFDDTITVSAVGYATHTEVYDYTWQNHDLTIVLTRKVSMLDEAVIIAYGTTTRRFSTSSISKITAADIATQPVSNPLSALQGRIPGLVITQLNGLPGSNFTVQLRGRNSLQQGADPLYIIDGVPLASTNLSQQSGALNASSPFSSINPADIESIEVLKDADATAIYGSRGANGVILITTKKGKAGATAVDLNYYAAYGTPARTTTLLNTQQYLKMRREAFQNDATTPTLSNAPDLLAWDSTAYTGFVHELIGGTAHTNNVNARLSGGNASTAFSLGLGYNRQTTPFPSSVANNRYSALLNLQHTAPSKKFTASLSLSFADEANHLPLTDLTQYITQPPNLPPLYDSLGRLSWSYKGTTFTNPLGLMQQVFNGNTHRLTANTLLSYRIIKDLFLKCSLGYNYLQYEEYTATPIASQSPLTNPKGAATFAGNGARSWIAEPRLEYRFPFGKGGFQTLVGASLQRSENASDILSGAGYNNDALLGAIGGAASLTATNDFALYKYQAVFGRITYNWQAKYILDLTGRYDGSSRFGPGRQFAPFGAAGFAWLFSEENFIKRNASFLSYGKLRGSYGVTGNDQIGNYQYLDSWGNTQFPFQGTASLLPLRLFNDQYGWERNRKLEAAIELGFFKDRLLMTVNAFRNRSDNQLIAYSLPSQTGFTTIIKNFPALVQNKGLELELNGNIINRKGLRWSASFNFTTTRNALLSFPGLAASSYANTYRIGQPLSMKLGYHYTGINPQTGIYTFADLNGDSAVNSLDYIITGNTDPLYYGGFGSGLSWKQFDFSVFFQYVNQQGRHPVFSTTSAPGLMFNRPALVLDRWQKPGDLAAYQQYTASTTSQAGRAARNMAQSDAALVNASFVRLKNLSLSYTFSPTLLAKWKLKMLRCYVEGQNLFTFTRYPGSDPENQSLTGLPPLRILAAGIQLTL
jgi:TonB-linked SusC/RagA family outer membrane protein